jgi:hypothetical protein
VFANWVCIYVQRDQVSEGLCCESIDVQQQQLARDFLQTIKQVGESLGMKFYRPTEIALRTDHASEYERAIADNVVLSGPQTTQAIHLLIHLFHSLDSSFNSSKCISAIRLSLVNTRFINANLFIAPLCESSHPLCAVS